MLYSAVKKLRRQIEPFRRMGVRPLRCRLAFTAGNTANARPRGARSFERAISVGTGNDHQRRFDARGRPGSSSYSSSTWPRMRPWARLSTRGRPKNRPNTPSAPAKFTISRLLMLMRCGRLAGGAVSNANGAGQFENFCRRLAAMRAGVRAFLRGGRAAPRPGLSSSKSSLLRGRRQRTDRRGQQGTRALIAPATGSSNGVGRAARRGGGVRSAGIGKPAIDRPSTTAMRKRAWCSLKGGAFFFFLLKAQPEAGGGPKPPALPRANGGRVVSAIGVNSSSSGGERARADALSRSRGMSRFKAGHKQN